MFKFWFLLLTVNLVPQVTQSVCNCGLKNASLSLADNQLQFVSTTENSIIDFKLNVSRCQGTCSENSDICRPSLTSLKTVTLPVPWNSGELSKLSLTLAIEEHKSCVCVDANSINVSVNFDSQLRRELDLRESEKLSREIRSVAPTISNAIITTYPSSSVRKGEVTNREIGPDGVKPTEHEIVYYRTCLACREQQDLCKVNGQIYDSEVCHCVYPASRTFLNSFYTLGVVMLTVMVCCFLVFGVQKGDENVLNSSRRSTRRSTSTSRRCSSAHHHHVSRQSSRRYSSRTAEADVERNCSYSTENGLRNGSSNPTNNSTADHISTAPDAIIVKAETSSAS